MNSNSNRPPHIKLIFGAWTVLWVVVNMGLSFALFAMQFNQSVELASGMQSQSTLLTGGSDGITD